MKSAPVPAAYGAVEDKRQDIANPDLLQRNYAAGLSPGPADLPLFAGGRAVQNANLPARERLLVMRHFKRSIFPPAESDSLSFTDSGES